jgi:uncharacterized protein YcbK (DUF882 family)
MKYFALSEFDCTETGQNRMDIDFLKKLDELREVCGFSFYITSGYRAETHSEEKNKPTGPGTHTLGIAADIKVASGAQRMILVKNALSLNFSGVGVAKSFIHVDTRKTKPVLWSY